MTLWRAVSRSIYHFCYFALPTEFRSFQSKIIIAECGYEYSSATVALPFPSIPRCLAGMYRPVSSKKRSHQVNLLSSLPEIKI